MNISAVAGTVKAEQHSDGRYYITELLDSKGTTHKSDTQDQMIKTVFNKSFYKIWIDVSPEIKKTLLSDKDGYLYVDFSLSPDDVLRMLYKINDPAGVLPPDWCPGFADPPIGNCGFQSGSVVPVASNTPMIIGATVGALVCCLVLVGIVIWWRRRNTV